MATVKIYLECSIVKEDLLNKSSLSEALDVLQKLGRTEILVLSPSGVEPDDVKEAFEHQLIVGGTEYMENMQDVTKDIVYMSDDMDNIVMWAKKKGKAIVVCKGMLSSSDYAFNRISPFYETKETLVKKLRKFIHI